MITGRNVLIIYFLVSLKLSRSTVLEENQCIGNIILFLSVYLFLFIYNHGITVKGTTHNSAKITLKLKNIFKSMGISKQDM